MNELFVDVSHEFRRYKAMAERAMGPLDDEQFVRRLAEPANPIALIVKHVAGNLFSRWTDFLTTDGEKPTRDRDSEFVLDPGDRRQSLMAAWERGWEALFATLGAINDADLDKTIPIRGEPHTVRQAVIRSLSHTAYHVGQIVYIARLLRPDAPWQTIAPGQSKTHVPAYRKSVT